MCDKAPPSATKRRCRHSIRACVASGAAMSARMRGRIGVRFGLADHERCVMSALPPKADIGRHSFAGYLVVTVFRLTCSSLWFTAIHRSALFEKYLMHRETRSDAHSGITE